MKTLLPNYKALPLCGALRVDSSYLGVRQDEPHNAFNRTPIRMEVSHSPDGDFRRKRTTAFVLDGLGGTNCCGASHIVLVDTDHQQQTRNARGVVVVEWPESLAYASASLLFSLSSLSWKTVVLISHLGAGGDNWAKIQERVGGFLKKYANKVTFTPITSQTHLLVWDPKEYSYNLQELMNQELKS